MSQLKDRDGTGGQSEDISPFATPSPAIREGFRRVVSGLALDPQQEETLFQSYVKAHQSGDPRAEQELFVKTFGGKSFIWPWFDEWHERFAKLGDWPRTWNHVLHEAYVPPPPASFVDAAEHFKLRELRQWVKDRGVTLSRRPRSKAEYCKVLAAEVSWEDFRLLALQRHAEMVLDARKEDMEGKAKLLAHTVMQAVFKARDRDRHFAVLSATVGWADWLFLLLPSDDSNPIRTLSQQLFDETFENGRGLWPPYFPGDWSVVVLTQPEWEARRNRKSDDTETV